MNKIITLILFISCSTGLFAQTLNNGLLACYPFTGNSLDESGNGHNGTVYGSILTTDRFNNPNSAYSFDGVNDYIDLGLFSGFTQSNNFTISVWIQPDLVKSQTILMVYPDDFNDRFNAMAYYSHNGTSATIWDFGDCTGGGRLFYPGTIFSSAWQHYVYTVNQGTEMKVYKNGILQTSQPSTSTFVDRNRSLWIGGGVDWSNANFYFDGKIDDMRLYDRELTEVEIQALYTLPSICSPTSLADASINDDQLFVFETENGIQVNIGMQAADSEFKLFNVEGKTLYSRNNIKGGDKFEVELSQIASGVLFYSYKNSNRVITDKIFNNK